MIKKKIPYYKHLKEAKKIVTEASSDYYGSKNGRSIGCAWLGGFSDGQQLAYGNTPCHKEVRQLKHANLRYSQAPVKKRINPEPVKYFFTSAWVQRESCLEPAKRWFKWLMSDSAPWYQASKDGKIHYDKKGRPLVLEFRTLDSSSCPGRIFAHALIMSRMPFEQPGLVETWAWLVDNIPGMTKERALVYAHNFPAMDVDAYEQGVFVHNKNTLPVDAFPEFVHTILSFGQQADLVRLENKDPRFVNPRHATTSFYRDISHGFISNITFMWGVNKNLWSFIDKNYRLENKSTQKMKFTLAPKFVEKFFSGREVAFFDLRKIVDEYLDPIYGKDYRTDVTSK